PTPKPVLFKTWIRMRGFLLFAAPLLIAGSLAVGALHASGVLGAIVGPLSPLTTGLLGLPAVAIIPLLYGFIRKEGALVLLVALAGTTNLSTFMSPLQLFVFALVVAIYIPCVATIAVIGKELGWRDAALITVATFSLALVVGGLVNHLNPLGL
ncbi:MAG: nucleoside recognition domain-containing protein, partial [Candidatus Hadarchaeales archaeon]